jgi:hypothetical protein
MITHWKKGYLWKGIFQVIQSIDKLDSDYNQNKIDGQKFIALQHEKQSNLEDIIKDIGIKNVINQLYRIGNWYSREIAFDFIVSKMSNKIKEHERVDALSKAFQYIVKELNKETKAGYSYYLNKAIDAKNPKDSKGIDQKDFIRYELHKYAWLALHPGQEMADAMFKCFAYKDGHDLPDIPLGVDKPSLWHNLKEYAGHIEGSLGGEFSLLERLNSLKLTLELKDLQLDQHKTAPISQVSQMGPNNTSDSFHDFEVKELLGEGAQECGK